MTDDDRSKASAALVTPDPGPRMDRRTALKNIGALAGAAPAVTLMLSPSAARARGYGGSPCEDDRHSHCHPGRGHGDDRPGKGHGWGHQPDQGGHGWGSHGRGGIWGKPGHKPKGRHL